MYHTRRVRSPAVMKTSSLVFENLASSTLPADFRAESAPHTCVVNVSGSRSSLRRAYQNFESETLACYPLDLKETIAHSFVKDV